MNIRKIYLMGFLALFLLIYHSINAYSMSTWAHLYHWFFAPTNEERAFIQQTMDGGYIVAGDTKDLNNSSSTDLWILKLNSSGSITWQNTYVGAAYDYAKCIRQTSDGGYIVLADTNSYQSPYFHIWVIKLDMNGGVIWQYIYAGIKGDYASSIQQTSDGGYIIAGYTDSFATSYFYDIWILKLDANGGITWQKTYGGPCDNDDIAYSIQQTSDGGYIVAGYTISCDTGNGDIWVFKLDANGGIIWQKMYSGTYGKAYSIQQTSDGGYIVAGYGRFFGSYYDDIWVLKLDANGGIAWQKIYGSPDEDVAYSIQQTSDGGYVIAGNTGAYNYSNYLVLKLDANGGIIWKRLYDSRHHDIAYSIQQASDGGYIVAGYTDYYVNGSDILVLKLDANGEMGISCNLIKNSSICQHSSSLFSSDTNALITATSIVPTHYSLPVQSTTISPIAQCDTTSIDLQPYLGMKPDVDDSGSSTPNGIIEPDEVVTLRGHLQNLGYMNAYIAKGVLTSSDPINIIQPNSVYGDILSHSDKYCAECYSLAAPLSHRPGTHWDFTVNDQVSANGYGPVNFNYTYHVGDSFSDVPSSYIFYSYVEKLLHPGITSGCTTTTYCPNDNVQRQQMAKFICASMAAANPCSCGTSTCSGIFDDVPSSNIFCPYIETLYFDGIIAGCQASPLKYCPDNAMQRQAMAKIICLGMELSIPGSCVPSGCSGIFTDVPSSNLFCPYIEALYHANVISGCATNLYCPASSVNRGQMAKFLVNAFGFKL